MSGPFACGAIQDALAEAVERHGSRRALAGRAGAWTYRELGDRIDGGVVLLRDLWGSGRPRHVGFRLGNRPAYVSLYFATLYADHLPLLLDPSFNVGEIEAIRSDCGLDALVLDEREGEGLGLPGAGEAVPCGEGTVLLPLSAARRPDHAPRPSTRVCRFTSGTTGRPKCLEFSGEAVVAAARNWVLGTGMTAEDRTLCLAVLSNGLAFNTSLLATFLAGAELHFLEGPPLTRRVAERVAASAVTRLVAFPALYRNFVAPGGPEPAEMSSLRFAISAGAPLWPDVREGFRTRFALDVSDYYGIAETGPCTFERDPDHHQGLGRPLPGVELRIAPDGDDPETGEVLVRTASMASGYLNHPGLFEERLDADGFYRSGDRGRLVDGRLHLVGRTQDHINVAGRKIDPVELVSVVRDLPEVADAVAFPDEDLNREAVAHLVVVLRRAGLTRRSILAACRSRLAPYKVPGRISFVDEIPRNGIGKPRIGLLRERLGAAPEPVQGAAGAGETRKEATR